MVLGVVHTCLVLLEHARLRSTMSYQHTNKQSKYILGMAQAKGLLMGETSECICSRILDLARTFDISNVCWSYIPKCKRNDVMQSRITPDSEVSTKLETFKEKSLNHRLSFELTTPMRRSICWISDLILVNDCLIFTTGAESVILAPRSSVCH